MKPKTHYQVREEDPNRYIMVSRSTGFVTDNFTMLELYNPKVGLKEHPLSMDVVDCLQLIRSFTGVPIRVNSTYRNYIPTDGVNPATTSPHMLAQAIDFSFMASKENSEKLYVAIREDFDRKGPLFQLLWEAGCRGFGSYDTFIHIDTVRSELYAPFKGKRGTYYRGEMYARWNNMKSLLYRKADVVLTPAGELQPSTESKDNPVVEEVKSVVGTVIGVMKEIFDNEDQGKDFNALHLVYLLLAACVVMALAWFGFSFVTKKAKA